MSKVLWSGEWKGKNIQKPAPKSRYIITMWCLCCFYLYLSYLTLSVLVWKLRGNIIRTALCWIVWHNVHSQQHTYMSSSYGSNGLGLSHWDPYTRSRGSCLELYYCNMVQWCWWTSSLISTTNWFNRPWNDLSETLTDRPISVCPFLHCNYQM